MHRHSLALVLGSILSAYVAGCGDDAVEPRGEPEPPVGTSSSSSSSSSGEVPRSDAGSPDAAPDVDALPVTIETPRDDSSVHARNIRVSGRGLPGATLTWSLGTGPSTPIDLAADGSFAFDVQPTPGPNEIRIAGTNEAGEPASLTRKVHFGHRISCGNSQTAMVYDGTVITWGRNERGQLGNGSFVPTWDRSDEINETLPASYRPAIQDVVSLVTRQTHVVALHGNGTVSVWGDNESGQLGGGAAPASDCGSGVEATCANVPVLVPGVTDAVAIDSGYDHVLVVRQDGTVLAWGGNSLGQSGGSGTENVATPTPVPGLTDIVQVGASIATSYALDRSGHVFVWGSNAEANHGGGAKDATAHPTPTQIPGLENVVSIVSSNNTALALLADGTLKSWGRNHAGQAGIGAQSDHVLTPQTVLTAEATPLTNVEQLAADGFVSVAVTRQGQVYTWGLGGLGQLAQGLLEVQPGETEAKRDLDNRAFATPIKLPAGTTLDVREIEAGAGGPVFAWTHDKLIFGWGWSFQGSLGRKDFLNAWAYASPVKVYPAN